MDQLQAVRAGRWKLYLPLEKPRTRGRAVGPPTPARLYDLEADLAETRNLADEQPAIVSRLLALAEAAREDLGDVDRPGRGQRRAGTVSNPTPRLLATD
jgi:hypothetical protein